MRFGAFLFAQPAVEVDHLYTLLVKGFQILLVVVGFVAFDDVFFRNQFGVIGGLAQHKDRQKSDAFGAEHVLDEFDLPCVFFDGLISQIGLASVTDDVRLFNESIIVVAFHGTYGRHFAEGGIEQLVVQTDHGLAEASLLGAPGHQ